MGSLLAGVGMGVGTGVTFHFQHGLPHRGNVAVLKRLGRLWSRGERELRKGKSGKYTQERVGEKTCNKCYNETLIRQFIRFSLVLFYSIWYMKTLSYIFPYIFHPNPDILFAKGRGKR